MTFTLTLTIDEITELRTLLIEEAQRMDDEGREGAFDKSPLKGIYQKTQTVLRARQADSN